MGESGRATPWDGLAPALARRPPRCPACVAAESASPGAFVRIGDVLQCDAAGCGSEHPIVDGLPILHPDLPAFVRENVYALTVRDDLAPEALALLIEANGQGSVLEAHARNLGQTAWDHWGVPDPSTGIDASVRPGGIVRLVEHALERLGGLPDGPVLDAGCGAGRSTFELAARLGRDAYGVDLGFAALRVAESVRRDGRARYPVRRGGLLYGVADHSVDVDARDRVAFAVADVASSPFAGVPFAAAFALNLIDCCGAPLSVLRSLVASLAPGGKLVLASPYDWAESVAPAAAWIGGHSPRGFQGGRSEAVLRAILTPGAHPVSIEGVRVVSEDADVPWHVRVHDRHVVSYRTHLLVAERVG